MTLLLGVEQMNAQDCDQAPIHCLPDESLSWFSWSTLPDWSKRETKITLMILIRRPWRPPRSVNDGVQLHWTIISFAAALSTMSCIHRYGLKRYWHVRVLHWLMSVGTLLLPTKLYYPRGKPVLKSIFQRIASLKTFNVCFRHYSSESCRSFLEYPAPNLETLNLIITTRAFQCPATTFFSILFLLRSPLSAALAFWEMSHRLLFQCIIQPDWTIGSASHIKGGPVCIGIFPSVEVSPQCPQCRKVTPSFEEYICITIPHADQSNLSIHGARAWVSSCRRSCFVDDQHRVLFWYIFDWSSQHTSFMWDWVQFIP